MQPKWFEAGAKDYGFPPLALLSLEFLLMGFLELKRYQGFKKTGTVRRCRTAARVLCIPALLPGRLLTMHAHHVYSTLLT